MKTNYFLLLLAVLLLVTSDSPAQLINTKIFKKPAVVMDATFGYGLPAFDFAGSKIKDFWQLKGYGINGGYYAAYTPKVAVSNFKAGQIRTYLTISFAQFIGSDNSAYNISNMVQNGWPKKGIHYGDTAAYVPIDTAVIGSSSIRMSAPYIAYGWELALYTDRERRSIFNFGLDFDVTVMWGKIYDQPYGKQELHNNIISATRLGLGMNLGYSYRVTEFLGISFGTRFQISNLFNKKSDIVTDDGDIPLNDESNVTINKYMNSNRSIGFFGFNGGVSFYIGGKR